MGLKQNRVLWIGEELGYSDKLISCGYDVSIFPRAIDALPRISLTYDAICLNYYFLSWGDAERTEQLPKAILRDIADPLTLGLWIYKKIREGPNKSSLLYLLSVGHSRNPEGTLRVQNSLLGDRGPLHLMDLIDVLPSDLSRSLEEELAKK